MVDSCQRDVIRTRILEGEEFYSSNSRFARLRKRPLRMLSHYALNALSMIKPFTVSFQTPWGETMRGDLPDSGAMFLNGYHEANLANLFVNLLELGDVFLDIGAHIGFYSVLASSLVGDDGRVVSIEPTPRTFGVLSENTKSKENVAVHNIAALDEAKTLEFLDYGPRYGALNSFDKESSGIIPYRIAAEPVRTKTVTIDELCRASAISPTVVKIDAEGSERLILSGMQRLLAECCPIITMEVVGADFNQKWGHDSEESVQYLVGHGYEVFRIAPSGQVTKREREDCSGVEVLLFVHPHKRSRVEKLSSQP